MAIVNMKDSRWLQLEVCREWTRNKCTRPDAECKFAHPATTVEVQNGRVVACYDSIKGRCNREKPPCKYFHPPQHLKDQLLINGRNHLALKNALMQSQMPHLPMLGGGQMSVTTGPTTTASCEAIVSPATSAAAAAAASVLAAAFAGGPTRVHQVARHLRRQECTSRVAGVLSPTDSFAAFRKQAGSSAYVTMPPAGSAYGSYAPLTLFPGLMSTADQLTNFGTVVHTPAALVATKSSGLSSRSDRLEICREFQRGNCKRTPDDCRFAHPPDHVMTDTTDGLVTVCMDFVKGRCSRDTCRYLHPPPHLQSQLRTRSASGQQSEYAPQAPAALFSLLPQHPVTSSTAAAAAAAAAVRPSTHPYRL